MVKVEGTSGFEELVFSFFPSLVPPGSILKHNPLHCGELMEAQGPAIPRPSGPDCVPGKSGAWCTVPQGHRPVWWVWKPLAGKLSLCVFVMRGESRQTLKIPDLVFAHQAGSRLTLSGVGVQLKSWGC